MNLAAHILKDRQLAEEVLQDTFIDLVEKATQIREPAAIVGWVRRVATNHCLMKLRSPWHARRVTLDADDGNSVDDLESPALDSDPIALDIIEKGFAQLSDETRAVVWLHDVEGYTHREIGDLMGKTTSYSKSQLTRGYEKLLVWHRQSHGEHIPAFVDGAESLKTENKNVEIDTGYIKPTCAS